MPEGDILRRAARSLDEALAGQRLVRAELRWPSAAGVDLVGATVLRTVPYGKHLFTRFDDGRSLHTHLRMEGSWRLSRTGTPEARARSPWVRAVLGGESAAQEGGMCAMHVQRPNHSRQRKIIFHSSPSFCARKQWSD